MPCTISLTRGAGGFATACSCAIDAELMTKATNAAVIIIELRMCMHFFCTEAVMMRECPLPGKLIDRFGAEIGEREEGSAVPRQRAN